tara:strand:+ start:5771 stop:6106 length:336 start_codon:yes stop_codon:yes gene_type:complete
MNSFQKTIITISTIILIISLILVSTFLSKALMEETYPPIIADCPDYWDVTYDTTNNIICSNKTTINEGRQHNDKCKNINITQDMDICQKSQLARECDLAWDGVTNNKKACE